MEIKLKRAEATDIPILIELDREAESRTYSAMLTEKQWLGELTVGPVYLIEVDGEVAGVTSYEIKKDGHAYISSVVVKRELQGQGIAKKAMNMILEELKEFKVIDLVTHPDNINAIKLYESLGFTKGERMENFFGDGQPRIKMILNK